MRVAGHAGLVEVGRHVAGAAVQPGHAVAAGPAVDARLVGVAVLALERTIARGVAVDAARVQQHLAGLGEQLDRAPGGVAGDKARDRAQAARLGDRGRVGGA